MKANELEEFSAKELDRLARERDEAIKQKGGLPYLGSLPVGESKLILQAKIPTDNPDRDGRPRKDPSESKRRPRKYCVGLPPRLITGDALASKLGKGSRMQFVVKKAEDGEDFAWTVKIKSPLYRDLLGFLVKAPIMLRVIRTGEGRTDTRYTVKAA